MSRPPKDDPAVVMEIVRRVEANVPLSVMLSRFGKSKVVRDRLRRRVRKIERRNSRDRVEEVGQISGD
jgi:hypothetical protein